MLVYVLMVCRFRSDVWKCVNGNMHTHIHMFVYMCIDVAHSRFQVWKYVCDYIGVYVKCANVHVHVLPVCEDLFAITT